MSDKKPSKAMPATLIPGINRIKPNHDREMLRQRGVKSPKISEMPFSYHNPREKYTKYFATLERKNLFLQKLNEKPAKESLKKGGRQSAKQ